MKLALVLWLASGALYWTAHYVSSFKAEFWSTFSAHEKAYYEANKWFFDALGLIWSLIAGPIYPTIGLYRWLTTRAL